MAMTTTKALAEVIDNLKRLHPVVIDLSLGRIEALLDKLGRPQDRLPPVIHVAGTNGKGSTVSYLRSMIQAAGLKAHVYTSPHLVRFNERIVLATTAGKSAEISDEALIELLGKVEAANGDAPITFFEFITAAALCAYAEAPADALVLEVGLGGRLDTTNVVPRPAVTVITPVSHDHHEFLGETLEAIATEKAGIFRRGVPAIVGPQEDEALAAIKRVAAEVGAPLTVWGEDFDAFEQNGRLVFQQHERLVDLPLPGLVGRHQIINAGVATAAALALPFELEEEAIGRGIAAARWPARFMRLDRGPLVSVAGELSELWLDGGHNPAAGVVLAQSLADLDERSSKPVYLIVGMMTRKDAVGFLAPFVGLVRGMVAVPIPGHEEGAYDAEALADIGEAAGLEVTSEADLVGAVNTIEAADVGPKRILICGSLYLAGHVLAELAG